MPPNDNIRKMFLGHQMADAIDAKRREAVRKAAEQPRGPRAALPKSMVGSLPRTIAPSERAQWVEEQPQEDLTDEIDDLVKQMNTAAVAPNGKFVSELARHTRLRYTQQNADPNIQKVFINPPSAYKGVLGGSALVTPGSLPQRVINWNSDNFDEATVMTISLAVIDDTPAGVFNTGGNLTPPTIAGGNISTSGNFGAQNRPFANIYWAGGRGSPQVAQVDIGKGLQLSIAGSFVAVDLGLDPSSTGPGFNPPSAGASPQMNLGAWLAFFSAYRSAPVTRTVYIDGLGPTSAIFVFIPPFARQLLPMQMGLAGAQGAATNYRLDIIDRNATVVSTFTGTGSTTPIPIGDDYYQIAVTNKDGANNLTLRLVFELGL